MLPAYERRGKTAYVSNERKKERDNEEKRDSKHWVLQMLTG